MHAAFALFIYGSVAAALVAGGIYALNRGFNLVMSGRGRPREECTVELLGFRATVGSIGSFAMVTAFLWGYAAVLALPKYKDPNITIALAEKDEAIGSMNAELTATRSQLASAKSKVADIQKLEGTLAQKDRTIKSVTTELMAARSQLESAKSVLAHINELENTLSKQQTLLASVRAAIKASRMPEAAMHAEAAQKSIDDIHRSIKKMKMFK
jgi:septal ring factor EnvC (AmiA/AmiB activator)